MQHDYSDMYNSLMFFIGPPGDPTRGHDDMARRISERAVDFVDKHWRREDLQAYVSLALPGESISQGETLVPLDVSPHTGVRESNKPRPRFDGLLWMRDDWGHKGLAVFNDIYWRSPC